MTIFSRDAARFWWKIEPPKDVAYYYRNFSGQEWQVCTYTQIFQKQKEQHLARVARKVAAPFTLPAVVEVFCCSFWLFGGWYVYVNTRRGSHALNFRHGHRWDLIEKLMQQHPCGVLPHRDNFEPWAAAFAKAFKKTYPNKHKKRGRIICRAAFDQYGWLQDLQLNPQPCKTFK